jgi:hypothetical protein
MHAVDLYWLPLGAGGHSVRLNGRVYEAVAAGLGRRPRRALYHSALVVTTPAAVTTIEMTPVARGDGHARGVVAEGPVGSRLAGRLRLFRYEVRCWPGGVIPDLDEAVGGPHRLADDAERTARTLALVREVPTPVWGRDELHAGEMWNSNSVMAWLVVRAGLDRRAAALPPGGRAPGWDAGLAVAARQATI